MKNLTSTLDPRHALYDLVKQGEGILWQSEGRTLMKDVDIVGATLVYERESLYTRPKAAVEFDIHPLNDPAYLARMPYDAVQKSLTVFPETLANVVPEYAAKTINDPSGELAGMVLARALDPTFPIHMSAFHVDIRGMVWLGKPLCNALIEVVDEEVSPQDGPCFTLRISNVGYVKVRKEDLFFEAWGLSNGIVIHDAPQLYMELKKSWENKSEADREAGRKEKLDIERKAHMDAFEKRRRK